MTKDQLSKAIYGGWLRGIVWLFGMAVATASAQNVWIALARDDAAYAVWGCVGVVAGFALSFGMIGLQSRAIKVWATRAGMT